MIGPPRGFLLALVVAGCSHTAADRDTRARVDTLPDGRVEIANTGASAWTPETAWRLEEDLRLGTAEAAGPEPERFGRIMCVVSDSRGMIYVLDVLSQEIRVFHPTGTFSHTIGGRGRGPGELVGVRAMTVGPGDTLWVTDGRGGRYSAFAPDGTFLRSHPRHLLRSEFLAGSFQPDGSYVDWGLDLPEGMVRVVFQPIRLAPGFERPDSLPPLEFTREMLPDRRRRLWTSSGRAEGMWDA